MTTWKTHVQNPVTQFFGEHFLTEPMTRAMVVALAGLLITARAFAGVHIWTCDVVSDEMSTNIVKELKPINLVGARNGTFSGKVVIESTSAIHGVQASVSALTGKSGGVIAASNVQLRYGKAWDLKRNFNNPIGPDILLEAPAEIPVWRSRAVLPVWVTVKVPKDVKAGKYTGEVIVQGVGVPLSLDVADWTLPDPQDYRTFLDFVECPDTLALEYNVPLWSEAHWKLITRSFQLLSATGGRVLYVPLICRSNFGNEQSMVRWIPRPDGRYDYDFTVMDKYLDIAEKNLGKPKLVVFNVWDICMSAQSLKVGLWSATNETAKARQELLGKGPRVTVLNPETKETRLLVLPRYEDPQSKMLWGPMFTELRKRMEKRGLEKTMMLGLMPDLWPNKEEVAFWKDISGGLAWAIHGHAGVRDSVMIGNKGLYKIADIGYAAFVYDLIYNVNPDKGRMYGWRNPALLTCYERGGQMNRSSGMEMRELLAFDITGGERGAGRLGGEYWPVVRNSKGERSGPVYERYPENNWRNLDICDWLLAPGPDGVVATVRLECLKEGAQVCEARIFLEDALLNDAKKAKLGADLAKRAQDALDEHHRAMWKTVWNNDEDLKSIGAAGTGRFPYEGLYKALEKAGKPLPPYPGWGATQADAAKGKDWYVRGWQDRERKLFNLAGEVAAKLNLFK